RAGASAAGRARGANTRRRCRADRARAGGARTRRPRRRVPLARASRRGARPARRAAALLPALPGASGRLALRIAPGEAPAQPLERHGLIGRAQGNWKPSDWASPRHWMPTWLSLPTELAPTQTTLVRNSRPFEVSTSSLAPTSMRLLTTTHA